MSTPITAKVIAATRLPETTSHGLITLEIVVPGYIWTELLTHRRTARGASSNRAMKTQRAIGLGYYLPPMFMQQGEGMTSSPLPVDNQQVCAAIWQNVWDYCAQAAQNLSDLGVSNEFSNRVFPTYKMMHGVITATEDGWRYLRRLRQSKQADWTMQIAATIISEALAGVEWAYRSTHLPYITDYERSTIQGQELFLLSGARCARVSYARQGKGKTDKELYTYLLDPSDPHLAPFEHAAIWTADPPVSPLNCVPADRMSLGGWYPFRYVYSSANGETVFQPK